ncbi:MAG TPA: acetylxylan esterase [Planctomycetota bacterium]|nr:acetylxylan esterase [Planctomycetota bacterium]
MIRPRFNYFLAALLAGTAWLAQAADTEATRAAFLKIVDRPRVPLAPELSEQPAEGDYAVTRFTYASDADSRVPGILLKKSGGAEKRPVVIVCHGTSGTKNQQKGLLKQFCAAGFIGVAIDGRYHGERCKAGSGDVEYCEAIHRAYMSGKGHPLYYDTVWDLMRLIDYLETRPDVDAKRIGIMGFSKGGIETFLLSGVDARIAVAVPCIGVQSFKWGLENGGWKARIGTVQKAINAIAKDEGSEINVEFARKFYDKLLPRIYSTFDGPSMLACIAPRPLMVINGDTDKNTPVPGILEAAEAAKAAYKAANADDRFVLTIQEKTGHTVNPDQIKAAIAWFVKWLAPQ